MEWDIFARMKTQYYTATSLDGFIATEDDSLEWLFPLGNMNDSSYPEFIAEVGALANRLRVLLAGDAPDLAQGLVVLGRGVSQATPMATPRQAVVRQERGRSVRGTLDPAPIALNEVQIRSCHGARFPVRGFVETPPAPATSCRRRAVPRPPAAPRSRRSATPNPGSHG